VKGYEIVFDILRDISIRHVSVVTLSGTLLSSFGKKEPNEIVLSINYIVILFFIAN